MDNANSSGQTTPQPTQPVEPTQDQFVVQQPAQPQQPVQQPQPAQPPAQPASPSQGGPISGSYKEGGPVADTLTTHEVMQPTETAPELAPEVKEAGVEVVHEVPQLTLQDQKAGIQPAKETVPHATGPDGSVKLPPMTQEEAIQTVKTHKKVRDAIYWIALSLVRQFSKKHEQQV